MQMDSDHDRSSALALRKRPRGRPTKYRREFSETVIKFCSAGYSLTSFSDEIGVVRDTLNDWMARYPEFSQAVKRAKQARARWWETRLNEVGTNGGNGRGQTTAIIFALKNVAPEEYSDQHTHRHIGPAGGAIQVVRVERVVVEAAPEPEQPTMIEGEVIESAAPWEQLEGGRENKS
jgi:hypothetical protein